MQDSWLNIGFLGDELKPYKEPNEAIDEKRIGNYFDICKVISFLFLENVHNAAEVAYV